jgi:hypothetical protein
MKSKKPALNEAVEKVMLRKKDAKTYMLYSVLRMF